jgi:hypothetical protein
VDDVVSGTESKSESVRIFEQFRDMLSTGGFNLRKYVSSGTDNIDSDTGGSYTRY